MGLNSETQYRRSEPELPDAQMHERLGEVHDLFTIVADGDTTDGQVCALVN